MALSKSRNTRSNPRQPETISTKKPTRFTSAFKKVGNYLQQQAQEQSHSALYLSPRDTTHRQDSHHADDDLLQYLPSDPNALPYGVIPPIPNNLDTPRSSTLTSMTSTNPSKPAILSSINRHQYASDNILQSYDVLIPDREPASNGLFLIFIHGGYFRDPKQTSKSFIPTISLLESSPLATKITGYASLNYRLSPHPDHPQPPTTPSYTLNAAHWPDQPSDILAALKHLQSHYPQSKRYVLAGHSVGATLSFLAAMRCAEQALTAPHVVLGLCGIYDFPWIHKTNEGYEAITANAMDPEQFVKASPALYAVDIIREKWIIDRDDRGVTLAYARDDELVRQDQTDRMDSVLRGNDANREVSSGFTLDVLEMKGGHWDLLENGELARCFERILEGEGK